VPGCSVAPGMWELLESVKSVEGLAGLAAHKVTFTKQTDIQ